MSKVTRWYIGVYGGEAQARGCAPNARETIREHEGQIFVLATDFDEALAANKAGLAREAALRQQLDDATTSLETISQEAGRDENMKQLSQVRGYANSRAVVARNFLILSAGAASHE